MRDELVDVARRAGRELAGRDRDGTAQRGPCWGTVTSVGASRLGVTVRGAALSLPMTTACSQAKAGDRCVVETIGTSAVVTGIIAG